MNEILLEDERQKENTLVNFQRQLATLLLDYGSSFQDPYDRVRFVIQMKTRTALRLFKANWKGEKSLLFRPNVSGVYFGHPIDDYEYDYMKSCTINMIILIDHMRV